MNKIALSDKFKEKLFFLAAHKSTRGAKGFGWGVNASIISRWKKPGGTKQATNENYEKFCTSIQKDLGMDPSIWDDSCPLEAAQKKIYEALGLDPPTSDAAASAKNPIEGFESSLEGLPFPWKFRRSEDEREVKGFIENLEGDWFGFVPGSSNELPMYRFLLTLHSVPGTSFMDAIITHKISGLMKGVAFVQEKHLYLSLDAVDGEAGPHPCLIIIGDLYRRKQSYHALLLASSGFREHGRSPVSVRMYLSRGSDSREPKNLSLEEKKNLLGHLSTAEVKENNFLTEVYNLLIDDPGPRHTLVIGYAKSSEDIPFLRPIAQDDDNEKP